ncbi:hypothetical protein BCR44DRAFT_60032 [Catenaria anguillulae PL171]|uniref:Uncharacterized protein n=1 Tax=Catenaria anguillulae PL171 TaxID=765915 RepID=A0A1Y2HUM2_9FUNG|nr:hypothetical protein BCR44DRAFT_60032 [Catenaria anguillulae PL171]
MTNTHPNDISPTDIADLSSIALTATPSTNTVAVTWTSATAGQQTYAGPADLMPEGIRLALGHMLGLSPADPPAYHPDGGDLTTAATTTGTGNAANVRRHQFGPVRIELPGEFGPAEQEATERAIEQAAEGLVEAATTLGQYVSRSVGSVVDARVTFTEPTPEPATSTSSWSSWTQTSSRRNSTGRQLGMHVVIDNGGTRREFTSFGSLARYVVQALFTGGVSASQPCGAATVTEVPPSNENDGPEKDRRGGDEKKSEKKASTSSSVSEIGEDLD